MSQRILWIVKGLGKGGAERLVFLGAKHIDFDRYRLEIAYQVADEPNFVGDLQNLGLPLHHLAPRPGRPDLWPLKLAKLLRSGRFDIVHTHSPLPGAVTRLARGINTPLVHTEHNSWRSYRRLTRLANTSTFSRLSYAIAVSEDVAASMTKPFWAPWMNMPEIEVVLQGIDEPPGPAPSATRQNLRHSLGVGESEEVVAHVASFRAKKDHSNLLSAIVRLTRERPNLRLLLFGKGPLENDIRSQVEALGLKDIVSFMGNREDVKELLWACDLFVLSSRYEGLPLSLLEALSAGLPVVVTNVGGIAEVVTHGVEGYVVPPGEPDALALGISRLLADSRERCRMGRAAVERASNFSIKKSVRRLEEIYAMLSPSLSY